MQHSDSYSETITDSSADWNQLHSVYSLDVNIWTASVVPTFSVRATRWTNDTQWRTFTVWIIFSFTGKSGICISDAHVQDFKLHLICVIVKILPKKKKRLIILW